MSYLFLAICLICALCAIAFELKEKYFWGMVTRGMASVSFIAVTVVAFTDHQTNLTYFLFLVLGLLMCHLGETFLSLKDVTPIYKKRLMPIGISCFLVGLLLITLAFIFTSGFNFIPLVIALGITIVAIAMLLALKINIPLYFKLLIFLYAFVLVYMASSAVYLYYIAKTTGALLAMLGALLFVISDFCFIFAYFKSYKYDRSFQVIETSTYFSALSLISLSMLFI